MFSGYEQHDAQEFLKALLEGIHEDLNRVNEKPPYKELKADVNRPLQTIVNTLLVDNFLISYRVLSGMIICWEEIIV